MPANTEDYERIPPMRRVRDACVLRVYPDGLVALNGKLLERSNEKSGSRYCRRSECRDVRGRGMA